MKFTWNPFSRKPDLYSPISAKVKFTAEGGFAIKMINNTGSATVKGTVVTVSTSIDNGFIVSPANSDEPIGIVYDGGVSDGDLCFIVIMGIADILLKDTTSSTRGNWAYMSDTGGRADMTNADPIGTPQHWRELGHCIESKGSGTDVLAKAVIHFN